MSKQPEALRLADLCAGYAGEKELIHCCSSVGITHAFEKAAAELRRLHRANAELLEALRGLMVGCDWKTLQGVEAWHNKQMPSDDALTAARAAIAKATGSEQ